MKKIKNLILILLVGFTVTLQAQNDEKGIMKVNYTSGCVSEFMVGLLKKQIQDAQQFTAYLSMMEDYKIHSSFYLNLKTNESVFVMDSISEVPNVQVAGYAQSVYINPEGDIIGKELFMGKDIDFKGNVNEINWTITNEQKEINGYQCKKAHITDNEGVSVWFAPEIAVNGGPYVFFGLPGLVLETNGPFETTNVSTISYTSVEKFRSKVDEVNAKSTTEKEISLTEVFSKKENFQRMIQKGTE